MNEKSLEHRKNFHEFIELNKEFTPPEAIAKLVEFGYAGEEDVLAVFINLREFAKGKVIFKKGLNGGNECIVMEGRDENDNRKWNHPIDMYTGRPMSRVG